jgi:6-phosphofructokinase 1
MMGLHAVECLRDGRINRIVAYNQGEIIDLDIEEALAMKKTISPIDLERARILAL